MKYLLLLLLLLTGYDSVGQTATTKTTTTTNATNGTVTSEQTTTTKIGRQPYEDILVDLKRGVFRPYSIPFDVPFIVHGPIPKDVVRVNLSIEDKAAIRKAKRKGKAYAGPAYTWERNLFTDSASEVIDFYINVSPLDAVRNYKFNFSFDRAVSPDEANALNELIRPFIKDYLRDVYHRAALKSADLSTRLQDTIDKGTLVANISNAFVRYYSRNNKANLKVETIEEQVKANLYPYLVNKYLPLMVRRMLAQSNLKSSASSAKRDSAYNVVTSLGIWQELGVKYTKLGIAQGDIISIQNQLADRRNLKEVMMAAVRPGRSDITVMEDLAAFPSSEMAPFADELDSLILTLDNTIVWLTAARADSNKLKSLVTSTYGAADLDADLKELVSFKRTAKTISRNLEEYIGTSKALEDSLEKGKLDFNVSFPVYVAAEGATVAEFVTRGEWYLTADIGIATFFLDDPTAKIRPYVGVNFNFSPINRQKPYSILRALSARDGSFFRSFSCILGLTVARFETNEKYRDLFTNNVSLLTGIGMRLSDGVRLSGGGLWSYKKDPNELVSKQYLNVSPYVALSLDLDLRKYVERLATTIGL